MATRCLDAGKLPWLCFFALGLFAGGCQQQPPAIPALQASSTNTNSPTTTPNDPAAAGADLISGPASAISPSTRVNPAVTTSTDSVNSAPLAQNSKNSAAVDETPATALPAPPPNLSAISGSPPVESQSSPPLATAPKASTTAPLTGIPPVRMSAAHEQGVKVKVGDLFPQVALPDGEGQNHTVADYQGKPTVVIMWRGNSPFAVEALKDAEPFLLQQYGKVGLRVVAINSFEKASDVAAVLGKWKPEFALLWDTEQKILNAVGGREFPRIYLLDSEGRVLWLDIEYSRSTRRQLQEALRTVVKEI